MQPESVFSVCNTVALLGWIALAIGFRKPWGVTAARWLAIAFAVVYIAVLGTHFGSAEGGFDTLPNVLLLFTNKWVALGGWVHYLAFDLFTGAWIVSEGQRLQLAWWKVIPTLPLTFMFG